MHILPHKVRILFITLLVSSTLVHTAVSKTNPAEVYEAMPRDKWQKPIKVLRTLKLDKLQTVLCEIGAGNGYFAIRASNFVKHVYAVDIDSEQLELLLQKLSKYSLSNITPILSTPTNTTLENNSCDVILIVNTYHHFNRQRP